MKEEKTDVERTNKAIVSISHPYLRCIAAQKLISFT
jgi:hypothetical protein